MPDPDYRDGPCRLVSLIHLAQEEENDPDLAGMNDHLSRCDGVEMHGHALVAELVVALNRAYALSLELALFHACHNNTSAGDPVLEWKHLAILLERELAEHLPCQVQRSLESQFDLPAAGEEGDAN